MEENVCGIFNAQGIANKSRIKIVHLENLKLKGGEYIKDTLLESYDISDSVIGEIYSCNITHTFLMESKKLPLSYVSVIYELPLRRILLFKIFLYFNITMEIRSAEQLLTTPLTGYFNLEIHIDNTKKDINSKLEKYPGDDKIKNKLKKFTLADETKSIIETLVIDAKSHLRSEFQDDFNDIEIPQKTISLEDYL
jgi:hypothetical protein